tara:strand:+ start:200 stop:1042 length:843 start_codon:yes stop_codon:yes gene_type:complete
MNSIENLDDYMSDSGTEDVEEVNENDIYETVIKKGIDRKTNKTIKVLKSKPIPIPKKNNKNKINKKVLVDLKEIEEVDDLEEIEEEIIKPIKPIKTLSESKLNALKKAREKKKINGNIVKSNIVKIKKQIKREIPEKTIERTFEKTKIIYMIPTNNGFMQCDTMPTLNKKELKYLDNDELVSKEEIAIGKKLIRTKNGTADNRSKFSDEALEKKRLVGKRLAESNKKRYAEKKLEKEKMLNSQVKKSMIEIVTKPISELKKEITPPVQQQYDFSSMANNF